MFAHWLCNFSSVITIFRCVFRIHQKPFETSDQESVTKMWWQETVVTRHGCTDSFHNTNTAQCYCKHTTQVFHLPPSIQWKRWTEAAPAQGRSHCTTRLSQSFWEGRKQIICTVKWANKDACMWAGEQEIYFDLIQDMSLIEWKWSVNLTRVLLTSQRRASGQRN